MRLDRLVPLVILAALGAPVRGGAQVLPERPLTLANGDVSVSGEVTASIGQRGLARVGDRGAVVTRGV